MPLPALLPAGGTSPCTGRAAANAHLEHCLQAGLKITGLAQGDTSHKWSYTLGPCPGVDFADELWLSRFILLRVAEEHGMVVSFDPRLCYPGGGLGCYVKYSCEETRQLSTGLVEIQEQVERLQGSHVHHLMAYGWGSVELLAFSPAGLDFSCRVGNKASSIMVPTGTVINRCGYYVDCRPSAAMDPYLATMLLVSTSLQVPLPYSSTHLVKVAAPFQSAGADCSSSGCLEEDDEEDWGSESMESTDSEDLLLDELDKMDGYEDEVYSQTTCGGEGEGDSEDLESDGESGREVRVQASHCTGNDSCTDGGMDQEMDGMP